MAAMLLPLDPDDDPEDPSDDSRAGRMGFLDHLEELRKRIIRSCIAIGSGMVVAFLFVDRIGDFILGPTLKALPPGDALIFTKPGEGFAFYLDVSFIGGVILAAPFVMYQVWQFIAPGLYAKEKRFAVPFVVLTTAGSVGGALFTHYIMFPGMIAFLAQFHSPAMRFMPRVEDTFDMQEHDARHGRRLPDSNAGVLPGEDAPRDRGIPVAPLQIRDSDQFYRRGRADAVS